jgi:hypothetical protein
MNSARRTVTIIFRFVAVCLVLHLLYTWIAYLLTPLPDAFGTGGDMNRMHRLYLEGMLRSTVVKTLCAVALFLIAPFLGRFVTRGSEE